MDLQSRVEKLASVDIFAEARQEESFVGRPFYLDYDRAFLLIADSWKMRVGGIPQGTFLLAFYENEEHVCEALLLRALCPTKLPTDNDVIASMIEYYKDDMRTAGRENQLDDFTRYEFSFSGLECRILGTFYKNGNGDTVFGADVENFYSSHNYSVYKPRSGVLELIVNFREGSSIPGSETDIRIGKVRYSSSLRFQESQDEVPVYVSPRDFLGTRTALFGMTRTGKSNTVKKIIQATVEVSGKSRYSLDRYTDDRIEDNLDPFDVSRLPKYPAGQIVFDINGEYANANMQDEGTAIFEMFKEDVIRYSVLEKDDFKVMKVNFYNDILSGFELVRANLADDGADYVGSFAAVDLSEPEDQNDYSAITRYERKKAAYLCCLHAAGFRSPQNFRVRFRGNTELNELVREGGGINPSAGINLDDAVSWFTAIWDGYHTPFFERYRRERGREWADEDLKALMVFLTRKRTPGGSANISGYRKLRGLNELHTDSLDEPFEKEIVKALRSGKIVIVDLSQGDPKVQRIFSDRICAKIFQDAMARFVSNKPNNFIQLCFEEAHNLFPKREDTDLSQIYSRIAKEGAKLNLGVIYATQEVSSISSNILKNTQNWFIAHLNNEDELGELRKYYDFSDFADSLIRFSAVSDRGFVRMKTYSNPFVVPVQIDRFTVMMEER